MRLRYLIALLLSSFAAAEQSIADRYADCLVTEIQRAEKSETVEAVKNRCAAYNVEQVSPDTPAEAGPAGLISERIDLESSAADNRFSILPHKKSYILPVTYNSKPNNQPFEMENGESDLDNYELKFQFSFKTELFDTLFRERDGLYFAYTNQSYWQYLDSENSGPIRDTNHQPELFFEFQRNLNLGSWHLPLIRAGWAHQSNGQSAGLSRSWNRLYGEVMLERDNWAISLRPWLVVNGVTAEQDSEDIDDFMGNFELEIFRQNQASSTSLLFRNNLQAENRGAVEINWSRPFPYSNKVRLLLQYFYGYGESLIDFDKVTNRIGIGLQLNDFL